MLQVGITGGIGAGKSIICQIFKTLGVPTYDADSMAKWLMVNNVALVTAVKQNFGAASYHQNGTLNRQHIASQVFNDAEKLATLNGIVHPILGKDYQNWAVKRAKENHKYSIKEAALLFDNNSYKLLDKVITVYAPITVRVQRVLTRDKQRSEKEILAIIERQISEEKRQEMADFVITNDDKKSVIFQVLQLHQKFTKIQ